MNRYLDTLFRNSQVFIIPLLVTPLMALLVMLYIGKTYEVEAVIWAQPSQVLDPMAEEERRRPTTAVVANQREAQAIQEWLETEAFRREVMDRVGLTAAIQRGDWPIPSRLSVELQRLGLTGVPGLSNLLKAMNLAPPDNTDEAMAMGMGMVKNALTVTAEGQNLVRVTYKGREPVVGQRVVEQVVDLYRERVLETRTQEAQTGIEFYSRQLQLQEDRLQQSMDEYQQFLETHPAPTLPGQARPASEEAALENLRRAYLLEQTLYESYLRKLDEVRIESEAAISNRDLTFRVVDPPQEPDAAGFSIATITTTLTLGIALGAILGMIPIVVMTWLDGSVRTAGDIERIAKPKFVAQAPLVPVKGKQGEAVRGILAGGTAPSVRSSNGREMAS